MSLPLENSLNKKEQNKKKMKFAKNKESKNKFYKKAVKAYFMFACDKN